MLSSLIQALINTGGVGVVAAVLVYLHAKQLRFFEQRFVELSENSREDMKATLANSRKDVKEMMAYAREDSREFRAELQEERKQCHEDNAKIVAAISLTNQSLNGVCRAGHYYTKSHDQES